MVAKSVLCLNKDHQECITEHCQCSCHHEHNCDCFACKIRSISFGDVPGGYKSNNVSSPSRKKEDF
jgi:hypothetical protein